MPHPVDLTAEVLAQLAAEYEAFRQEQKSGPPPDRGTRIPDCLFDLPHFREAWFAGAWLGARLREAGANDTEIDLICFANGQKCFHSPDPWKPTIATLGRYLAERTFEEPGLDLARRLIEGER